jgi:ribonuclease BN (tRNA processing enzyme)
MNKVTLTFAGAGGFFADQTIYQSNVVITSESPGRPPRRLLVDCGTDAKFSLAELGLDADSFEAVYVTHQHGDHSGGLEWLGFKTYFSGKPKPKLVCNQGLMRDLWETGLKGSMSTLQGKVVTLSEFFDCNALPDSGWFFWSGILFRTIQTVHVVSGFNIKHSHGLIMCPASVYKRSDTSILPRYRNDDLLTGDASDIGRIFEPTPPFPRVLFTGDCRFGSPGLEQAYNEASLVFHDCEVGFHSGVHPNYHDLKTLPDVVRKKMILYHIGKSAPSSSPELVDELAAKDGFKGIAHKGLTVDLW